MNSVYRLIEQFLIESQRRYCDGDGVRQVHDATAGVRLEIAAQLLSKNREPGPVGDDGDDDWPSEPPVPQQPALAGGGVYVGE